MKFNLYERLFDRWTKWEVVDTNLPYNKTTFSMVGEEFTSKVLVDRLKRTNKFTGMVQYKVVEK